MTILIYALAVIGATWVLLQAALSLLFWLLNRRLRKRQAELFAQLCEAIERHPAGSRQPWRATRTEGQPWNLPAPCCGGTVYGDSLPELLANHAFHESQCPHVNRRRAA